MSKHDTWTASELRSMYASEVVDGANKAAWTKRTKHPMEWSLSMMGLVPKRHTGHRAWWFDYPAALKRHVGRS